MKAPGVVIPPGRVMMGEGFVKVQVKYLIVDPTSTLVERWD